MTDTILTPERKGFIVVTDTIPANSGEDVSDAIQALIDANPNRTIYFPDGVYLLAKPICTPADPLLSVDLQLSNYAVLKAADGWNHDEAMVRLGGEHAANNIYTIGSNYSFTGGIVDGSGVADGISIDSGRETAIREVSIKHTRIGIHIKHGANSGSSDADIMSVNIVGNGARDSVGVLVHGYDNSFTNMRIAKVFYGFDIHSGGNVLKNIHPLYTCDYTDYTETCAFLDHAQDNWYNFCYSDQFSIGFRTTGSGRCTYESCFCFWYSSAGKYLTAFRADNKFNAIVEHIKVGFREDTENTFLFVGEPGGAGVVENPAFRENLVKDEDYKDYLQGRIVY